MLREEERIYPDSDDRWWKRPQKQTTREERKLKYELERINEKIECKEIRLRYTKDSTKIQQLHKELDELYELKNTGTAVLQEYGNATKKQRKFRIKRKKVKETIAYGMIKDYINKVLEDPNIKYKYVTKEDTAYDLNIPEYQVEQIFRRLNIEGILSQAIHRYPHDNNRNPHDGGGFSGWKSDRYEIIQRKENNL